MTDDPDRHALPSEDLAQLRARAADATARLRELVEQSRELQAQAASLVAENHVLRDEVRFRVMALRKVDRFP
jgi:uncharacterized protein (DUF3084 family)